MSTTDKTKEELFDDLLKLQESYNSMKKNYENDVNQLKNAEERTRRSEEIFRKAFKTSSDSVNINRLSDGMYVSANDGFLKLVGYTEEEVIGKTSIELNVWADINIRKQLVKELTDKGKVENFSAIFKKKDGSLIDGLMSASLIDIDGIPHLLSVTKDITGRKQIEKALDKEQFLVKALLDNLPDHVYFKDRESRFIRNNRAHAQSFGLDDPDQAIGKSDFDFFTEEAARQAFDDEQKIIQTGQPVFKEENLTRKDNSQVWFSAMKLPLRDSDGNIIGTFGISRDITETKLAAEALKQSEERFRSVTESASDAIITTDSNQIIIGWNRGAKKIFGYTDQEILGQSLNQIIQKDFRELQLKVIRLLKRGGGKYMAGKTVELGGVRKDGSVFPVELSFSEWTTSEGKFFTGILRDISGRKRIELENQVIYEITQGVTSTSNLDELLKLIHNALAKFIYAENIFVALHNQNTDLFSFPYFVDKFDTAPPPTSMGKSCTAYVFRTLKPFLFTQDIYDRLVEQGEVELVGSASPSWIGIPLITPSKVVGVLVLQHYEKEDVYSENDLKLLMSIGSQIAIAIERKKAEEEIVLKNELLQTINIEKDKFFSILAHDLRGPLSAFVAATQILTEEILTMELEEIKEITESMKSSATNIYSLLENLLEWSRLKRGAMDFVPLVFNLKKRSEDCIRVLSETAVKKGIKIDIIIPDDLEIYADNHMFDTIIRNLTSNAIKFTAVGGMVRITADRKPDHTIEINISDSGIGMTPELKNKLFLINEKTSRKGTEGEASTGLGLLLCKEFIEKHEGKIWVESEVGKGSTFTFSLPGRSEL